jgi:two-component sensor histidine kinase/ligand-binding sensor domain-containing protein
MKLYLKILFSLLCLHLALFSHSQKYSFRNYTVANGLGSSSINHIFQDNKGYIWFATQGGGASRFNGKEFKNFTKADGLICNDVTYITEDKLGNIWIGTAQGASMFNGFKFTNYNLQQGLTNQIVYCIYPDSSSNKIYFATEDQGVKIYDGTKFNTITGIATGEIYTITKDRTGNLWFGTAQGILKYSNGKTTNYSNADKSFFSSLTDNKGSVWFGSMTGDVIIIHPNNTTEKVELPANTQNDFIGSIAQDKRGNIWLATDHGLLKYTGEGIKPFTDKEGLSASTTQAVMADYEGNIWAGTAGGGVDLLSSEAFMHYTEKDGLTSTNITSICPAKNNGTHYIGTGDGLYVFNKQTTPNFKKLSSIKPIEHINIASLTIDGNGLLWIAAQEGVYVLETKNNILQLKRQYHKIADSSIISPTKTIHDSKGNIWLTTYGSGVFLINDKEERNYNAKSNFSSNKVLTVFEDSRYNIWFGTQDAGAIKYDGQNFSPLLLETGRGEVAVWSITETPDHTFFLGTGENGIYRYDGKEVINYTAKNGLCSNYIPALQYSKKENCLWLGSEAGLQQLSLDGDYRISKLHTYKQQDGFQSTGINQNGIGLDEEDKVWLGTINGLWVLNQQNDQPQTISPKIQLTDLRLFYQKTDWNSLADSTQAHTNLPVNLKMPFNKNHLTFYIQALTANDVSYTCILEGQDEQWSSPTQNNEITYSNISPGTYTFKAKAITAQGKQSEQTVSFSFVISPPWWQTWWFRVLVFVIVVGLLFAFIQIREGNLKQQNRKLETTVQQRTLEISQQKQVVEQTLTEKEGLLQEKEILLKEIHHRVKNNLQTISSMLMLQSAGLKDEQAKKAITESQSRVRSIALVHQKLYQTDGLEKVELNAFVKDLIIQIQSLYRNQSTNITIQQNIPETYLLIDKAIPLGLILNELFTNSFKYAFHSTKIGLIEITLSKLEADHKSHKVILTYRDNGPGLASQEVLNNATTLGLRLIKLLSQQIGATLNYSNSNGSEFIFTFTINV